MSQEQQPGHDHSSQDEAVTGGYGDPGEAEALTGDSESETDPKEHPKADPAEGSDPENPRGL
ncbi:hypothetical protein ACVWW9_000220 [Agrococcus sp. UYP33]